MKSNIVNSTINAFSEIEIQDLRVEWVSMPKRALDLFNREHDTLLEPNGTLWGADIKISPRFEVGTYDKWLRGDGTACQCIAAVDYSVTPGGFIFVPKHSRNKFLSSNFSPQEKKALETLREMITEKEFRKYLKEGFLLVKSVSGKIYQIFKDKAHTKVWLMGELIEEVCVRISREINAPPTDNVIAFKQMIETDEEEFRKCGNVYNFGSRVVA